MLLVLLLLLLPLLLVVPLLLRPPLLPPLPCMRRAVRYYIVFMCHSSCLSAHAHEHAHDSHSFTQHTNFNEGSRFSESRFFGARLRPAKKARMISSR